MSRNFMEIIINCGNGNVPTENIKKLGRVKYNLPSINSIVMEVPCENIPKINMLAESCVYKPITLSAQMNNVNSALGTDSLHKKGITGKGVTIAVLDTGISPINDFILPKNRIVAFRDFVNQIPYPYDDNGHGCQGPYSKQILRLKVPMNIYILNTVLFFANLYTVYK